MSCFIKVSKLANHNIKATIKHSPTTLTLIFDMLLNSNEQYIDMWLARKTGYSLNVLQYEEWDFLYYHMVLLLCILEIRDVMPENSVVMTTNGLFFTKKKDMLAAEKVLKDIVLQQ